MYLIEFIQFSFSKWSIQGLKSTNSSQVPLGRQCLVAKSPATGNKKLDPKKDNFFQAALCVLLIDREMSPLVLANQLIKNCKQNEEIRAQNATLSAKYYKEIRALIT